MTDLTEKVIDRLAREAVFKLEIAVMRHDWATGCLNNGTLTNQITNLHRLYPHIPTWMIRQLVKQEWQHREDQ